MISFAFINRMCYLSPSLGSQRTNYHAPAFFLSLIDRVQARFFHERNISPEAVVNDYALAPLTTRRDISMLGLLHRVVLGTAPAPLAALFPRMTTARFPRDTRGAAHRHDRQLFDRCDGTQPPMFLRSIFGLVYTYNLLPQHVVIECDLPRFQRKLQIAVRRALATGLQQWPTLFRVGIRNMAVEQFQGLFFPS